MTKLWYSLLDRISPSRYPFELPPAKDPNYIPSLSELVQEPYGTIKGHIINFWFYREGRNIVEVMEAGHSNTTICSRVTSLIHETLIELENIDIKLYTAGTLWLRIRDKNPKNQELLSSLEMHLRDLEQKTGLVKVTRASISELERFRQYFQKQHALHGKTKRVFTDYRIEIDSQNSGIFDYTQYPSFNSKKDISFTIKRSILENRTFKELAELHEASFRSFLIRDVIARTETYGKWLLQDILELMKLSEKRKKMTAELWLSNIIPYSGVRDYYIGEVSEGKGDMDPLFRKIEILYREWKSQFHKDSMEATKLTESLLQAVESWEITVSQINSDLDYGTTSHASRFEDTVPHFIFEDISWLMRMIKILIFESDDEDSAIRRIRELFQPILSHYIVPDYIREQFSGAFRVNDTDNLWEKLHHIMDHLVKSTTDLPSRLVENLPTIFKELSEIKKDLVTRHKRMEFNRSVNEWILIDALLRGWPSFFLHTKELKDLYDRWVGEVRERIWREIRLQLRTRKIKMLPFVEDNITYSIALNKKKIHITPYFGINSHFYVLVYHKKIGTVHYIFPWSYRDSVIFDDGKSNLQKLRSLMSDCWDAINRQDLQGATFAFGLALKVHPVRACSEFFEKLWNYLGNVHDPNVESSALLQKGLNLLERKESYEEGLKALEKYVSKYPDRFADPYIFLACGENFYKIMELQKNRENAIREYKEYLHDLDKAAQKNQITKIVAGITLDKKRQIDPRFASLLSNIELLNDVGLSNIGRHISQESASEILNTAEDKIGTLNITTASSAEVRKYIILELLASGFKKAMDRELKDIRTNIENVDKNISLVSKKLWADLSANIYYQKALKLDSNYAKEVLNRKSLFKSVKFQLECEPYFDLNIADSKMRIAMYLWFWVTKLKEISKERLEELEIAPLFLERLKILDREPLGVSEDDKQRIDRLVKAKIERLTKKPSKEDSITRLDLLSEAESIASSFMSDAASLYEKCHSMLPSFTPAYMKSMELRCILLPLYGETLQKICRSTPPLEMVVPGSKFTIEQDKQVYGRLEPHVMKLEENNQIVAYSDDGSILTSIRFECVDDLIISHIRESIQQPIFRRNLFPLSSSLANRILKTPISPSPRTKVFLDTLNNSIYPLIFVLAYMSARMSPHLSDTAFGVKASKNLLSVFRDDTLYTEEQRDEAKEYLKKLDNAKPIDRTKIVIDKVFNEVLRKEGYKF